MWKSKLRECTATSTTEAEYVAALDALKEALWLVRFDKSTPTRLPLSKATVRVLSRYQKNLVQHKASKHIDLRYHFVRNYVMLGKISLKKIPTTDNVADGMTKCLPVDRL